jgi:short-subunit dehydrogenase involved in D-alanine esterification of teichoic acids
MAQRVLVTAGASGIGLAIADAFLARGARVHVGDVDKAAISAAIDSRPGLSGSVADVGRADGADALTATSGARSAGSTCW